MNGGRALLAFGALALADFRERVRRTGFLVTLAAAAYLGYLVDTGRLVLRLGAYRGVYNSAWVGSLTALVAAVFLGLVGFYVVKGSVDRDRRTGVGEILATTPMSRPLYTLGKAASNFAVLAAMVAVLAGAAVVMQLAVGEEGGLELGALLAPIAWGALPALAFVAALAVLFETVPALRGGFGNVVYFFVWTATLMLPVATGAFDVTGIRLFYASMGAAARAQIPGYREGFVLGVMPPEDLGTFRWSGVDWTVEVIAGRLTWLAAAVGLALLAALVFDRFDPARRRWWPAKVRGEAVATAGGVTAGRPVRLDGAAEAAVDAVAPPAAAPPPAGHVVLTPLAAEVNRPTAASLLAAELRVLLAGRNRWWSLVALGLFAAGWIAPLDAARQVVLPLAWIWPLLLWSSLGSRDNEQRTAPLLFSSPRPVALQAPMQWAAGVALALVAGAGVGVRIALAGDGAHLAAFGAGALFVPALAFAAGAWSGGAKLFEAVYVALWYLGPLNRFPTLDFIGTSPAGAGQRPAVWLLAAALLLAAGLAGRSRRVRGG